MKRGKRRKRFGRLPRDDQLDLLPELEEIRLKKAAVTLSEDIRLSPLLMPSQQFYRLSPSWGVWEEDRDLISTQYESTQSWPARDTNPS
jgi:hypothetical protein